MNGDRCICFHMATQPDNRLKRNAKNASGRIPFYICHFNFMTYKVNFIYIAESLILLNLHSVKNSWDCPIKLQYQSIVSIKSCLVTTKEIQIFSRIYNFVLLFRPIPLGVATVRKDSIYRPDMRPGATKTIGHELCTKPH